MKTKEKILLVIDPQNDFISGSLLVPDALEKMNNLKDFIEEHGKEFDKVVITLDWHPANHCSFEEQGGSWPEHCVEYTFGALPPSGLLSTIYQVIPHENLYFVHKGRKSEQEEYGAFKDGFAISVLLPDRTHYEEHTSEITVTGIMSEYCVVETLKNIVDDEGFVAKPEDIILWLPGIATMDDHKTLLGVAEEKGITKIIREK